jgi:hypothetical protein
VISRAGSTDILHPPARVVVLTDVPAKNSVPVGHIELADGDR